MIEGKTKSGFEYKIEDSALNDWEVLEYMADLDEDNSLIVKIARRIFSKELYQNLKKHCTKSGIVQMDVMFAEIQEILNEDETTKNS